MNISDLKPADYNPRKISDSALSSLKKAMAEFGDLSGVVFNVRTGRLVGGHQRIKALDPAWNVSKAPHKDEVGTVAIGHIETPFGRWQYREVDWPEKKEMAANVAANKHGGEWDYPKLKDLLVELDDGDFDLDLTGFDEKELKDLIDYDGKEGLSDPDGVPEAPEKAVTKPGDLILLGEHRLLCGDATKREDVDRLMDGEKADMVFTDPPYGVSYEGKTKDKLTIENDALNEQGITELILSSFGNAEFALIKGAYCIATVPPGPLHVIFAVIGKNVGGSDKSWCGSRIQWYLATQNITIDTSQYYLVGFRAGIG